MKRMLRRLAALSITVLIAMTAGMTFSSVGAVELDETDSEKEIISVLDIEPLDVDAIVKGTAKYEPPIDREDGHLRETVTYGSFAYVLNNTYQQYEINISAPSNSAAIYTFYTIPSQGSVTMYIKTSMTQYGTGIAGHVFDAGGHSTPFSVSLNSGVTYYVYLQASAAPTTGSVSYTKITA